MRSPTLESVPQRATANDAPADDSLAETIILVVRIGDQPFALPATPIRRIVPMAALTPLPGAPFGVAGVLAIGGDLLPVVDPRPLLGLPPTLPRPDQHLIAIDATTHYLLWVDRAESVETLLPGAIATIDTAGDQLAPQIARLADDHLPILSPFALDPGPLLRRDAGARR